MGSDGLWIDVKVLEVYDEDGQEDTRSGTAGT